MDTTFRDLSTPSFKVSTKPSQVQVGASGQPKVRLQGWIDPQHPVGMGDRDGPGQERDQEHLQFPEEPDAAEMDTQETETGMRTVLPDTVAGAVVA